MLDLADSVYGALAASAARWPSRPLLHVTRSTSAAYGVAPGDISYSVVQAQADERAEWLSGSGFGPGMRLALLVENRPEFFVSLLAANRLGGSVVPINPDLRAAELEFLFGHAEPALVVSVPSRIAELKEAAAAAGLALPVVPHGGAFPQLRPNAVAARLDVCAASREAALLYTSGTTGRPKGCVLANAYFLEAARWYSTLGGMVSLTDKGERMITPLPVFHMNALVYSFMAMVAVGGCLAVLDRFHPRSWWQDVAASSATCLHYLGVMPSILMNAPPVPEERAHGVRFGFGAGVDPKLHAAFEEHFGFPLIEAWAMTETGAGAVIAAHGRDRPVGSSCIGKPGPSVEFRLVDESGKAVRTGADGELLVRRRGSDPRLGFFSEYFKDPEATRAVWRNGWFHTGDILRQDREGYLYFVDRRKNLIRRSGENVAAVEVESVLMRHPGVRAAAVAGVPDRIRGEEVFAFVVADDPSPAKAEEIARWGLKRMAYNKVPGFISFVDDLPLTSTQKVDRANLKAAAANQRNHPSTVNTCHLKKRDQA